MPRYCYITRYEECTSEKPDMSMYVPFYAKGVTKEIREKNRLVFSTKAVSCRMLGYADANLIHKIHNTYLVLIERSVCSS
jgi:hypothetical protein